VGEFADSSCCLYGGSGRVEGGQEERGEGENGEDQGEEEGRGERRRAEANSCYVGSWQRARS